MKQITLFEIAEKNAKKEVVEEKPVEFGEWNIEIDLDGFASETQEQKEIQQKQVEYLTEKNQPKHAKNVKKRYQ